MDADIASLHRYGPGQPELSLPMQKKERGRGLFTYWRTAPTRQGLDVAWRAREADLREFAAHRSGDRRLHQAEHGVEVIGDAGEEVVLSFLPPATTQAVEAVEVVRLTVSVDGTARVSCSDGKCAPTTTGAVAEVEVMAAMLRPSIIIIYRESPL